jgi:hypothetical protein
VREPKAPREKPHTCDDDTEKGGGVQMGVVLGNGIAPMGEMEDATDEKTRMLSPSAL